MRMICLAVALGATLLAAAGCVGERTPDGAQATPAAITPHPAASGTIAAEPGTDAALLPAALAVAGTDAEAAAELARIVLHGTAEGERLAALLTALHRSGIAVRDPLHDDRVVRTAAMPAQGIAVMIAEVVGFERRLHSGHQVALADIVDVVVQAAATESVDLRRYPLESLLLEDLRKAATAGTPPQRFWIAFLRELGLQGATGQDLLDPALTDQVTLDAVQAGLIMLRLAADVAATAEQQTPKAAATTTAAWSSPLMAFAGISAAHAEAPKSDCAMGDATSMLMDGAMAVSNSIFGGLLNVIEDGLEAAGVSDIALQKIKWAKVAHAITGNLLAIAKMFVMGSLMEAKIEFVDGTRKLSRTRHRHMDDELKQVRATLRLNAGGLQSMNCYRILLAAAGVDFNVGNDAPIKGSKLRWSIIQGGVVSGLTPGTAGDPGLIRFEGKVATVTDDKGQSTAMVVGLRQAYTIPQQAKTVKKAAAIRVDYSMKDTDLHKDIFDGLLSLLGGPIGITIELLQRMVPLGNNFHFQVIDYGADYRIDHTDPMTGIRLLGRKCGGPAGQWKITFTGNRGGVMQVDGESLIQLNYAGTGTFVTHTRTTLPDEVAGHAAIPPARTRGNARISADGLHLRLEPTGSDAAVQWAGTMHQAPPSRVETIPVQLGDYCSAAT